MKLKTACLGLGALLAATITAQAQTMSYGAGLKDRVAVPAPIPVPAPVPVAEGFSYYLRADLAYGWNADTPSFSESGNQFGNSAAPYAAAATFLYGQSPQFDPVTTSIDEVLTYGVGAGVYLTPRFRGDVTLEFRGKQGFDANTTYSYPSTGGAGVIAGAIVDGTVRETIKVRGTVALANLYWDLLPRGSFSPYIGGGIGFVYNDIDRTHFNFESVVDGAGVTLSRQFNATGKSNDWGLAAAVMGGVTIALDHKWALDLNYRALYLDGGSVDLTPSGEVSKATLGDLWEHQVRIGVRMNIW